MKKPEKGLITHQDTDETVVLGVLSAVIFFFTVLTISSYADNQDPITKQNLLTENTIVDKNNISPFIIQTNNVSIKEAEKDNLKL